MLLVPTNVKNNCLKRKNKGTTPYFIGILERLALSGNSHMVLENLFVERKYKHLKHRYFVQDSTDRTHQRHHAIKFWLIRW